MQRAVFLDRDGVLNRLVARPDGTLGSPRSLKDFTLLPGVASTVRALARAGFKTVVVTNQPDIARGRLDPAELERMHARLRQEVSVDAILTCPHDERDHCGCRKPLPGMLLQAGKALGVDLERSFLVGDSWKDIAAGYAVGCRTILVGERVDKSVGPGWSACDLPAAGRLVLGELERENVGLLLLEFERKATRQARPAAVAVR